MASAGVGDDVAAGGLREFLGEVLPVGDGAEGFV